jgi:hypothetical protein
MTIRKMKFMMIMKKMSMRRGNGDEDDDQTIDLSKVTIPGNVYCL